MSQQHTAWDDLPLGVQQRILVLACSPCTRRVSKPWRDAFDATNDTLSVRYDSGQRLEVAATAAATRVVKNSTSLTAVNLKQGLHASPPVMLSDLLAAGAASGLATRLHKLTGMRVTAACAGQQLQALRQCTGLTHLDVSASDLQDCPAADLTAALQAMPRLTHLCMRRCNLLSQAAVSTLAAALQPLTQLQQLHLAECRLGEAGLAALAPALSATPGLQTLVVGGNSVSGTEGAKALCTLLGAVPGLTHLDVSYSCFRDEGTALLAAVLRGMTCLQTLNIRHSHIGDIGMLSLAPALAVLPHLNALNLSGNQLGPRSASLLQPVLAREGSPLRELDLSSNAFQVEGAQSLASGLSTTTRLQELNLSWTGMGYAGWVALALSLSCLAPSLQSLELSPAIEPTRDSSLHDARSTALASALRALTGLTRLHAQYLFNPAAMVTVSPALMGMRRLQVLNLSCNGMCAEGTAAFAAALPVLAGSLKHLDLSLCRIDAEAAANALAPALAQATGLVELRLEDNDFGPQGAQWLVPVLSALSHLRKVDLQFCELGVQGCMAVARALEDRDGAHLELEGNDVAHSSTEGDELCN